MLAAIMLHTVSHPTDENPIAGAARSLYGQSFPQERFSRSATASLQRALHRVRPRSAVATSPSGVRMWSTFGDQRHAKAQAPRMESSAPDRQRRSCSIPAATKQEILGFGAAMTDSSCYVLSQMKDDERQAIMHDLFAPGEMALNVCRTCIGASDYSRNVYSFDDSDQPDPETEEVLHRSRQGLHPARAARGAQAQSRPLSVLLALESAGMDEAQQIDARRRHAQDQLRSATRATSGNSSRATRPRACPSTRSPCRTKPTPSRKATCPPACGRRNRRWSLRRSTWLPQLRKAGLSTKIWVLDHNYSSVGPGPRRTQRSGGVRIHRRHRLARLRRRTLGHDPGSRCVSRQERYWTEGGPDISQPDYQTDWYQLGRPRSMASSTTGRARSRRGTLRSTRKASPTSVHSPAAARSPLKTVRTR